MSFREVLGAAEVEVRADFSKLDDDLQRGKSRMNTVLGALGTGIKAIAGLGAALGAAGAAVTGFGIKANASMEQTRVAFSTLLGSAEAAEQHVRDLQRMAAETPFEFQGLADTNRLLMAMGQNAQESKSWLLTLGDAVAAMGGGQAELEGLARAIGQIQQKGKLQAEEALQLAERGIPVWQILADKMGLSVAEVQELASRGQLLADDVLPMLQDGLNEAFGGAMAAQAETFNGRLAQLRDYASQALMAFTGPMFAQAKEGLAALGELVGSPAFQEFAAVWGERIGAALAAAASFLTGTVVPALVILAGWIRDNVIPALAQAASWVQANVIPALGQLAGWITGTLIPALMAFAARVQSWRDEILPIVQQFRDRFIAFVNEIWPEVQAAFENVRRIVMTVLSAVAGFIRDHGDTIKAILSAAWSFIRATIDNALAIISNVIRLVLNVLQGDWRGAWENIKAILRAVVDQIEAILRTAITVWPQIMELAADGIKRVFRAAGTWLVDAGRQIVQGLIDGITGMMGAVWRKAEELAQGIKDRVAGVLDIFSPSRVMRELGAMIPKGFALGIADGTPQVARAATAMAAPVPGMAMAAATAGPRVSGRGVGPTVANIYFEVDGRTLARVLGQPLVDEIRLRTGVRR